LGSGWWEGVVVVQPVDCVLLDGTGGSLDETGARR